MKNFLLLAQGLDVGALLLAVSRKQWLWNSCPVRSYHEQSVHRVVDDIILRYNKFYPGIDDYVEAVCSRIEVENHPAWAELPEAQEFIHTLMYRVRGLHLGRVMISRLPAGASIPAHSDRIAPAEEAFPMRKPPAVYYDRYQIVLASNAGCVFSCGEESIGMRSGETWWFDNQQIHSVVNNSAEDRLALVIDIHSAQQIWTPPQYPVQIPAISPEKPEPEIFVAA